MKCSNLVIIPINFATQSRFDWRNVCAVVEYLLLVAPHLQFIIARVDDGAIEGEYGSAEPRLAKVL